MGDGSLREITDPLAGKVWRCEIDEILADRYIAEHTNASVEKANGKVFLKVVSDEKPFEDASETDASLEDAYIYEFYDMVHEHCFSLFSNRTGLGFDVISHYAYRLSDPTILIILFCISFSIF